MLDQRRIESPCKSREQGTWPVFGCTRPSDAAFPSADVTVWQNIYPPPSIHYHTVNTCLVVKYNIDSIKPDSQVPVWRTIFRLCTCPRRTHFRTCLVALGEPRSSQTTELTAFIPCQPAVQPRYRPQILHGTRPCFRTCISARGAIRGHYNHPASRTRQRRPSST